MKENWIIKEIDKNEILEISKEYNISPKIAEILLSREIGKDSKISKYLNPTLQDLYSPFEFRDMQKAVLRIKKVVEQGEIVGIFADSDLDGITSLTLLKTLFRKLKINTVHEFPQDDDGYGMNSLTIEAFKSKGVTLIITVDSGIRDIEAVSYAKTLGIDVLITDHHEQADKLPEAIIINPKIIDNTYTFSGLAGVGVAFKLAHSILVSYLPVYDKKILIISDFEDFFDLSVMKNGVVIDEKKSLKKDELLNYIKNEENNRNSEELIITFGGNCIRLEELKIGKATSIVDFFGMQNKSKNSLEDVLSEFSNLRFDSDRNIDKLEIVVRFISLYSSKITKFLSEVLPFVSLGTIADIMPLQDENRALVSQGLLNFKNIGHSGLKKLVDGVQTVDSKFVSWEISPLLNTPGRLGKTEMTVDFFVNQDPENLDNSLKELKDLNLQRKNMLRELINEITEGIDNNLYDNTGGLLLIRSDRVTPGLTGLVANRIAEYVSKPVIVLSEVCGSDYLRGSGRSGVEFSFFDFVKKYTDSFYKIGGHSQAFGFSIHRDEVESVFKKISDNLSVESVPLSKMNIDVELKLSDITKTFIKSISVMEPLGKDNHEPFFITRGVRIVDYRAFGENGTHSGLVFSKDFKRIEAIGWSMSSRFDFNFDNVELDVVYHLEINRFRGVSTPRMVIVDFDFTKKQSQ